MKKIKSELGNKIREIRKAKGLTQEKLGEVANLSFKYVGEVERGEVNISLQSLVKISIALGIAIGDLFDKSEEPIKIISKSPLSKLSTKEVQNIKGSLKALNKVFSKI